MRLEREATFQYPHVCGVIPGLLRTEVYAEEILAKGRPRDDVELARQVTALELPDGFPGFRSRDAAPGASVPGAASNADS